MKLLNELTQSRTAETIKIPTLKPRDPNQVVLANKKNAGGPMRDKKKELKAGRTKYQSRHQAKVYEGDIPETGDRVEYTDYASWKADLPKRHTTFRTVGEMEYAQTIAKTLEGISGKWNSRMNSGWIYEYYLSPKNLYEGMKPIKVKEPGWYVVDHMDRAVEGPMQEGAARRAAAEMTQEVHAEGGKGDIPAYDVLYFTDYEICRAKERAYESVDRSDLNESAGDDMKRQAAALKREGNMQAYHKQMIKYLEHMIGATEFNARATGPSVARTKIKKFENEIRKHREELASIKESMVFEKWNDSGASDANGRWSKYAKGELGVGAMATWLYNSRVHKKTKAEKLKSAYGAISQQENTSKLISGSKADALRAALKKKYSVNESEDPGDKKTEYVYRITFDGGYSTSWKTTHLHYPTVADMAKEFEHPHEGDQGWVTELVEPLLGVPNDEHAFYPEDYELISSIDDMLKLSIEYRIHHKDYNPVLLHQATLTIQAV